MSKWISVAYDYLPEDSKCIDLWISHGDLEGRECNCFYDKQEGRYWKWDAKVNFKITIPSIVVTHWMPLPKPPQGE